MTSPAQRVPVLMYHRIGAAHNDRGAQILREPGFRCTWIACARRMEGGVHRRLFTWLTAAPPCRRGAFLLTFDDGFRGVHDHAGPSAAQARLAGNGLPGQGSSASATHGARSTTGRPHLSADGSRTDPRAARPGLQPSTPTRATMPTCRRWTTRRSRPSSPVRATTSRPLLGARRSTTCLPLRALRRTRASPGTARRLPCRVLGAARVQPS